MRKIVWIVLGLAVLYLLWHLRIYRIDGTSMNYGLIEGDMVLTWRDDTGPIARGDLVVVRHPEDPKERLYLKRCAALPGDRYFEKDRRFYLQIEGNSTRTRKLANLYHLEWVSRGKEGIFLKEPCGRYYGIVHDPWLAVPHELDHLPLSTIPPGHYYTLGDFRDNSADSRFYGPVPRSWIRSRAIFIFKFPRRWRELIAIEEADAE